MTTVEINVYKFDELNDEAKEKAREWFREGGFDYPWYDYIYDDFKVTTKEVGFDVTEIYWSGFYSQGDGAMFKYDYISNKLRLDFINQLSLSQMRKDWLINNTMASGNGLHRGHYYHENSCNHNIYWEVDNGDLHWDTNFYIWLESFAADFEEYVIDIYKDLCKGLYRRLEKEWDYINADEQVDESITVNEYDFTQDGKIF